MDETTKKKKRVFVGIQISKGLTEKINNWKAKYHDLPFRWIEDKNLHITLIPPWYVYQSEIATVVKKLQPTTYTAKPFEINFFNISYGPEARRPRLIWVEGKKNKKLFELKKSIEIILDIKAEERNFLPHLTIARFNRGNLESPAKIEINEKVFWIETIENITMYESKLSTKGADYEILGSFKLGVQL